MIFHAILYLRAMICSITFVVIYITVIAPSLLPGPNNFFFRTQALAGMLCKLGLTIAGYGQQRLLASLAHFLSVCSYCTFVQMYSLRYSGLRRMHGDMRLISAWTCVLSFSFPAPGVPLCTWNLNTSTLSGFSLRQSSSICPSQSFNLYLKRMKMHFHFISFGVVLLLTKKKKKRIWNWMENHTLAVVLYHGSKCYYVIVSNARPRNTQEKTNKKKTRYYFWIAITQVTNTTTRHCSRIEKGSSSVFCHGEKASC